MTPIPALERNQSGFSATSVPYQDDEKPDSCHFERRRVFRRREKSRFGCGPDRARLKASGHRERRGTTRHDRICSSHEGEIFATGKEPWCYEERLKSR